MFSAGTVILFALITAINHVVQSDAKGNCSNDRTETVMEKLLNFVKEIKQISAGTGCRNHKPIAFYAVLTKTLTVSGSATVVFDKVFTNTGDAYDSKTGIFRAPVKGLYYFDCTFMSIGTPLHIILTKNNSKLTKGHSVNNRDAGAISGTLELEMGDKVFIQHYSAAGSEAIHGEYTSFTGYLISTS
ncbi:complement C1q-like protein 3 [Mytilus californianus]|uniref:complement C1q-like protein 3 n=1 Tax=Mytilus californianus TaxID=6549 RepID=UPI002246D064|nr:complement C1q-like protein 3 [Mytilus californianus]